MFQIGGYESIDDEFEISKALIADGKMSIVESLIPSDTSEYYPAGFIIFNKDMKPFMGARIYVILEENTLYGPYAITQDGRIEGMILINKRHSDFNFGNKSIWQ